MHTRSSLMAVVEIFVLLYAVITIEDVRCVPANGLVVRRIRRYAKHQLLSDPQGCVRGALSDYDARISDIKSEYKMRLVVKARQNGLSENSQALKKEAINNVRDMFQAMCKQSSVSQQTLSNCPKSTARSLALIEHGVNTDRFCFPVKGASDFNEYYSKEECAKKIRDQNTNCKNQCGGSSIDLTSATGYNFEGKSSQAFVDYETESGKNSAAAQRACANQKCLIECNRPLLVQQCGSNAFEWYAREKRYEPKVVLASLRFLGALGANEPSACAYFK